MAPAGIPLAGGAQDRDGLEMDVLHVPLGPVLTHWPAGLVLRCRLHGDVVADASGAGRTRRGARPRGPRPCAAARSLDAAAGCSRWPAGVRAHGPPAARATPAWTGARTPPSGSPAAPPVARARLLRWTLRGLGPVDVGRCGPRVATCPPATSTTGCWPCRPARASWPAPPAGRHPAGPREVLRPRLVAGWTSPPLGWSWPASAPTWPPTRGRWPVPDPVSRCCGLGVVGGARRGPARSGRLAAAALDGALARAAGRGPRAGLGRRCGRPPGCCGSGAGHRRGRTAAVAGRRRPAWWLALLMVAVVPLGRWTLVRHPRRGRVVQRDGRGGLGAGLAGRLGSQLRIRLVAGYRFLAQALGYELPLMFALTAPAGGRGQPAGRGRGRRPGRLWFVVWMPVAFVVFCLAVVAFSVWGPVRRAGGQRPRRRRARRAVRRGPAAGPRRPVRPAGRRRRLRGPAVPRRRRRPGAARRGCGCWSRPPRCSGVLVALRRRLPALRPDRFAEAGLAGAAPAGAAAAARRLHPRRGRG